MLVFLDTEFTAFVKHDLISLALVAEDGREFYAERTEFKQDECSAFVRNEVLPLLSRVPGASCDRRQLTNRLHNWFEDLPEPATLVFDFEGDWLLLVHIPGNKASQSDPKLPLIPMTTVPVIPIQKSHPWALTSPKT